MTSGWEDVESIVEQQIMPAVRRLADHDYVLPYQHERVLVVSLLRALAAAGVNVNVASWDSLENLLGRGCHMHRLRVIVSVNTPANGVHTP